MGRERPSNAVLVGEIATGAQGVRLEEEEARRTGGGVWR